MSDGTDRGAAMTDNEWLGIRRDLHAGRLPDHDDRQKLMREVDRLRALSTGEPSPDSAALRGAKRILDYLPSPCGAPTCDDPRCAELADLRTQVCADGDTYQRLVASYENKVQDFAAETARSASLHARLTAAERDAELGAALLRVLRKLRRGERVELHRTSVGDIQVAALSATVGIAELQAAENAIARAALPPAGDTRGEQPEQEQDSGKTENSQPQAPQTSERVQ